MVARSVVAVVLVLGVALGGAAYWAHLHHTAPQPEPGTLAPSDETPSCCPLSRLLSGSCTETATVPAATSEGSCCDEKADACPAKAAAAPAAPEPQP